MRSLLLLRVLLLRKEIVALSRRRREEIADRIPRDRDPANLSKRAIHGLNVSSNPATDEETAGRHFF